MQPLEQEEPRVLAKPVLPVTRRRCKEDGARKVSDPQQEAGTLAAPTSKRRAAWILAHRFRETPPRRRMLSFLSTALSLASRRVLGRSLVRVLGRILGRVLGRVLGSVQVRVPLHLDQLPDLVDLGQDAADEGREGDHREKRDRACEALPLKPGSSS